MKKPNMAFDPDAFKFEWEKVSGREFEWDPGRYIRIFRPPLSKKDLLVGVAIASALFGIVAGIITALAAGPQWVPVALLGALGAGLVVGLICAYLYREKEVVLDWRSGLASFREARVPFLRSPRHHTFPLNDIERVLLEERRQKWSSGGGSHHSTSQTRYGYEVLIETAAGRHRVALSDFHPSRVLPCRRTAPMAVELAAALGLPAPEVPELSEGELIWHERTGFIRDRIEEALKGKRR
jgi:hypothetical protein